MPSRVRLTCSLCVRTGDMDRRRTDLALLTRANPSLAFLPPTSSTKPRPLLSKSSSKLTTRVLLKPSATDLVSHEVDGTFWFMKQVWKFLVCRKMKRKRSRKKVDLVWLARILGIAVAVAVTGTSGARSENLLSMFSSLSQLPLLLAQ